jgi:ubiquinol-cytochrome c reductase cytochrome c1 subunit
MRRVLPILLLAVAAPLVHAAGGGGHAALPSFEADLGNTAGLQRGLRTFANYCQGCHSAQYMRYTRIAKDLDLTEEQIAQNLVFNGAGVYQTMTVALRAEDGARWFGVAPPDLSVIARARGADWLYAYLKGFYVDPSRPWGVNNAVFDRTAMPHVLGHLQGPQVLEDGHLVPAGAGALSAQEYDALVGDLVSFLVYLGEPAKLVRYSLGFMVVLFLAVLSALLYFVKREYWKDVH